MVRTPIDEPGAIITREALPLVVELVGPAGAGKTSLSRALIQCNRNIVEGTDLAARRIANIPFFTRNALSMLPTFLPQYRNGRWLTWEEIKAIVHLGGWHHALRRQAARGTITLLDHGPVYMMTWLRGFGPGYMRSRGLERWWVVVFEHWSRALDMLIWLDAPDNILLERIQSRDTWHIVKEKSAKEGREFLARYRRSYGSVISALTANDGPRVLRFNTDHESLSEIIKGALAAFDLGVSQG